MPVDAYFVPDAHGFVGTGHTAGPWDPRRSMHVGPPAALLGRCIELEPSATPKRVARITFEILRPVPIGLLQVEARVVRPGARIDLVEAVLRCDGQDVVLARAWRLRTAEVEVPATALAPPPPLPEVSAPTAFWDMELSQHYGASVETRFAAGSWREYGPATVWFRPRVVLVAGEAWTPLTRVLVAADSGNGISAVADPAKLLFVNTDLTVHLHREPDGDWVCLDAETRLEPDGTGLATTRLFDRRGAIGTSLQTLFVEHR